MRYPGHRPNDGRFPLLQNYSRVDRQVDQVHQWIGKDRSREAQEPVVQPLKSMTIRQAINKPTTLMTALKQSLISSTSTRDSLGPQSNQWLF